MCSSQMCKKRGEEVRDVVWLSLVSLSLSTFTRAIKFSNTALLPELTNTTNLTMSAIMNDSYEWAEFSSDSSDDESRAPVVAEKVHELLFSYKSFFFVVTWC